MFLAANRAASRSDFSDANPAKRAALSVEIADSRAALSDEIAKVRAEDEFDTISNTSVDFYWATCVFFRKTETNKTFFDLVSHIEDEWNHYRRVYQIKSSLFRNDFAFSIAIHIMGTEFFAELPGKMNYALDRDLLIDIKENSLKFLVEKKNYFGEFVATKTDSLDMHVMNKYSLTRCIDGVVNE